jgi:hypothetical protein
MYINNLSEITRANYDAARRRKDKMVAQTKFGFVIDNGTTNSAYITHDNKCYTCILFPWVSLTDFQMSSLDSITINVTATLSITEMAETEVKS